MSEPELDYGSRAEALNHHAICLLQIFINRGKKCLLTSCCVLGSVLCAPAGAPEMCEADLSLGGMSYQCGPGRWPNSEGLAPCPLKPTSQLESGFRPLLCDLG